MRLLQNILITHNDRFFESLFLSWNTSLIVWEYVCHQKMFVRKCLPSLVSGLYYFNPSSLSLKSWWLGCNNIQKYGEWDVRQNYQHGKGKGFREETIYFHFYIEYCSTRVISVRRNCHGKWGMETKSSRRPCQKL